MHLHLGGHLAWYDPHKRAHLEVRLREPIGLLALLQQLGVPSSEIAVAAVNGAVVSLAEARVCNDDRVELFPPIGGGRVRAKIKFNLRSSIHRQGLEVVRGQLGRDTVRVITNRR